MGPVDRGAKVHNRADSGLQYGSLRRVAGPRLHGLSKRVEMGADTKGKGQTRPRVAPLGPGHRGTDWHWDSGVERSSYPWLYTLRRYVPYSGGAPLELWRGRGKDSPEAVSNREHSDLAPMVRDWGVFLPFAVGCQQFCIEVLTLRMARTAPRIVGGIFDGSELCTHGGRIIAMPTVGIFCGEKLLEL